MQLGVFLALLSRQPLGRALDYVASLGISTVEVGTGNYPGESHCRPGELLRDRSALQSFKQEFTSRNIAISALSCHGNPLHPVAERAQHDDAVQNSTLELAAELQVETIIVFSGCPGGGPADTTPNWVTCAWPDDYQKILDWQWNDQVLPYWTRVASRAQELGVRVAVEMHPGFVCYNPETLMKLRAAAGHNIGANFDPSHLWWQGINPIQALRELKDCLFHVHAKDVQIDTSNCSRHGVLDTKPYHQTADRSWIFRTVGYGHDTLFWKTFVSTLRVFGYTGSISIEHEDELMSAGEGLAKAAAFLQSLILSEDVHNPLS